MGKFKKIKNDLIYRLVRVVIAGFNIIPRSLAVFLGALLGYVAFLLFHKDRRKAERHLGMAFGDSLSEAGRRRVARDMFMNFGKNAADVLRFKKYYHSQIRQLVEIDGIEHFEKVYDRGRGLIAITAHLGNFELMAAHMVNQGFKLIVIGRALYDKRLNELLISNREALGMINIDNRETPLTVTRYLKNGYALGVMIDTDSMRVKSELIPCFGRLSNIPIGPAVMGLRAGSGFVPMACVRYKKGYKLVIKPEVIIEKSGNLSTDVYNMTKKCSEAMESLITEYKEQWIWMHNRWSTRPVKPIKE